MLKKNLFVNGFVNLCTFLFAACLLAIILAGVFFVGSFLYYIIF